MRQPASRRVGFHHQTSLDVAARLADEAARAYERVAEGVPIVTRSLFMDASVRCAVAGINR